MRVNEQYEVEESRPVPMGTFSGMTVEESGEVVVAPAAPAGPLSCEVDALPSGVRLEGTAPSARRWVDMAQRFTRCAVACQVMAGFELVGLKQSRGVKRGGDRANPHRVGLLWEEFLRQEVGISEPTAKRWMEMAQALRPRLKKLEGVGDLMREILERPITDLSDGQSQLLTDTVAKLTDGRSQLDFLIELGLAKASQGSAGTGGAIGGGRRTLTPDQQIEAQRLLAIADWSSVGQKLQVLRGSFVHLSDDDLDGLRAALEAYATGMRQWRNTPLHARNSELLREIESRL